MKKQLLFILTVLLILLAVAISQLNAQQVKFNGQSISLTGYTQGVSSISLAFTIDTAKYQLQSVTKLTTSLDSGLMLSNQFGNTIVIGWYVTQGTHVHVNGNALQVNLLTKASGCSDMNWIDNGTACAISNPSYQTYATIYENGVVCNNIMQVVGEITYKGSSLPLPSAVVELRQNNVVIQSQITEFGGFVFDSVPQGNYTLTGYTDYQPGGINSTDALYVARYFVGQIPLDPLQTLSADANIDNAVNAIDANKIMRHFVFQEPIPSPWIIETKPVTPTFIHLDGICRGDVNNSYVP